MSFLSATHNIRLNIVFWNVSQDCHILFCSMWHQPTSSFSHLVAALIHCGSLEIHSHTLRVKLSWVFGPTADLSQSHNESPSAFSTRPSEWAIHARMSRTGRSRPTCSRMSNSTVTGGPERLKCFFFRFSIFFLSLSSRLVPGCWF